MNSYRNIKSGDKAQFFLFLILLFCVMIVTVWFVKIKHLKYEVAAVATLRTETYRKHRQFMKRQHQSINMLPK